MRLDPRGWSRLTRYRLLVVEVHNALYRSWTVLQTHVQSTVCVRWLGNVLWASALVSKGVETLHQEQKGPDNGPINLPLLPLLLLQGCQLAL